MFRRSACVLIFLLAGSYGGWENAAKAGGFETTQDGRSAIYLTDLDQCEPQSLLSRKNQPGTWRMLDYEAESFHGTMLAAFAESRAPAIRYPLGRSGWYEIYVGLFRKPFEEPVQVQVKLTDDPAWVTLEGLPGVKDHQANWLDEISWKTADLTGQDIMIRQHPPSAPWHALQAWVGFIKLIPLSEEEVQALTSDRKRSENKRLYVHTDAHYLSPEGSPDVVRGALEPLRHSDVSRIYWEAGGGDHTMYFSRIGYDFSTLWEPQPGEGGEPFYPSHWNRLLAQTWQAYHRMGVDPLRVAAEFAHELGIELHASYRMASFVVAAPHDLPPRKSFYLRHPELLCVDREGNKLPRISFAFPETRRFVISMFREMATNYPISGICLLYNRRPPLVAYEEPLVKGFQERYGQDPRQLDEKDPRWLSYRCSALTQFTKELREEMDAVSREQGREKPLQIAAVVSRKGENLLHGMDVKTWVEEGLIDTLIPYTSSERLNSSVLAWKDPEDVAYFVSLVKGNKCRLALNLMPRELTAEEYYRKAHALYQAGVENFFFWDGGSRVRKVPRLGHREEVAAWMAAGQPKRTPGAVRLRKVGIWDFRMETPG